MFELLRKDASKLLSKILLGVIILIFIAYFGVNFTGRRGQSINNPAGAPIAKVNGQTIPSGKFQQSAERQIEFYQQIQGNLTDEAKKMIESRALDQLILESLFAQEAYKLGLRVPDEELADDILSNRNFMKNGIFDEDFYLNQFKSFYANRFGQDYEYALREQLLAEKLRNLLEKSAVVSERDVNALLALQNQTLTVKKLEIPLAAMGTDKPEDKANDLAKQWIELKKEKKSTNDLLANQNAAQESELTEKNFYELLLLFGQGDALPILFCLIDAKPGEVCPKVYPVGSNIIAVELVEKKPTTLSPEKKAGAENQFLQAQKNQLIGAAQDLLTRQATIQTFLRQ